MQVLRATLQMRLAEQAAPTLFREPPSQTMQASAELAAQLFPPGGNVRHPQGQKLTGGDFKKALVGRAGQNVELRQLGPLTADLVLSDITYRLNYTRPPRISGWVMQDPAIAQRERGAAQAPRLKGLNSRVANAVAHLAGLHLALRTGREEIENRDQILAQVAEALDIMRRVVAEFPEVKLPAGPAAPTAPAPGAEQPAQPKPKRKSFRRSVPWYRSFTPVFKR